jgi:hypothetical protein
MRYILAIFIPPLAMVGCRKPIQLLINLAFWLLSLPLLLVMGIGAFVWLFCSIHALIVCSSCAADRRLDRIVNAIDARNQGNAAAKV